MIYNLFLLLMGGWCILSISRCQPLHAVGYPFDCPNIVCLISFPNINQTLKQNYPSQLEKISRYPKENEPEVFLNTHPYTNLAYNVMSAYLVIWWPCPQLRGELRPPGKTFSSSEKCLRHIVCKTIVFVHAIDVKFGPPSENSSPPLVSKAGYGFAGDCCLVTSVSDATQLSLFTIKFFRFDIKYWIGEINV